MKIPRHLSPESKKIWREIEENWDLDGHSRTILMVSLEAFDEMRKAQALIAKYGSIYKNYLGAAQGEQGSIFTFMANVEFRH